MSDCIATINQSQTAIKMASKQSTMPDFNKSNKQATQQCQTATKIAGKQLNNARLTKLQSTNAKMNNQSHNYTILLNKFDKYVCTQET